MATIAMMVGGAILKATTFVGGSYLAKYLSGDNSSDILYEKRHDKALKKYQKDYEKYMEQQQKTLDWEDNNRRLTLNAIASQNFANTDEPLKYYNRTHPSEHLLSEPPQFSDYYKPSKNQKTGEMLYVGGGMLALGYLACKWL